MNFKVFVTRKLPEEGLTRQKKYCKVNINTADTTITQKELFEFAPLLDAIIPVGTKINSEFIEKAKKLKIISNYGVGYDNIDVVAASKKKDLGYKFTLFSYGKYCGINHVSHAYCK